MRTRDRLFGALLLGLSSLATTGCGGQGLVAVEVGASEPIKGVARLTGVATSGATQINIDLPLAAAATIPASRHFGIDAPAGASLHLVLSAVDAGGAVLASGSADSPMVTAGERVAMTITLKAGALPGQKSWCKAGHQGFPGPGVLRTGLAPESMAAHDLDHDGKLDLIVGNRMGASVSVYMNAGGAFPTRTDIGGVAGPAAVGAGDFDGDGHADIVLAHPQDRGITVLFGKAGGGFEAPRGVAVAGAPTGLAVGDLDNDKIDDIAFASAVDKMVIVLAGRADRATDSFIAIPVPAPVQAVAMADMNFDGRPDLVVARGDAKIGVLLNQGMLIFSPGQELPTSGAGPVAILAVDLNIDPYRDVVTANKEGKSVSIFLGGKAGLSPAVVRDVDGSPTSIALGDLDGDSHPELVVGLEGGGDLEVLYNDVLARFEQSAHFITDGRPTAVVVGDLIGDGKADIAVANDETDTVDLYHGTGLRDPQLVEAQHYAGGQGTSAIASGDLDGDGWADLATVSSGDGTLSRYFSSGSAPASWSDKRDVMTGANPGGVAIGSLNGDMYGDVVVADAGSDTVSIFLGAPARALGPRTTLPTGSVPLAVAIADLDGDGKSDLVVVNHHADNITVRRGDGTGKFSGESTIVVGAQPAAVAIADYDHDGRLDIAVACALGGRVDLLHNSGKPFENGGFTSSSLGGLEQPRSVVFGDFDGDGALDVAAASVDGGRVDVFFHKGDGTFGTGQRFAVGGQPNGLSAADLDGDGDTDLAVSAGAQGKVGVLWNPGDGRFGAPEGWLTRGNSSAVVAGDLDHDGRADLAVVERDFATMSVHLSRCY